MEDFALRCWRVVKLRAEDRICRVVVLAMLAASSAGVAAQGYAPAGLDAAAESASSLEKLPDAPVPFSQPEPQSTRPAAPAAGQTQTLSTGATQTGTLTCPGGFPTDLTVTNCSFTHRLRFQQWITSSFTDQAILGAVVYGLGAEIIKTPGEWGRTWGGLGDRVGVRYTQAAARGTAEYIVGNLINDDPRHLSYKEDPHTLYGTKIDTCANGVITTRTYGVAAPAISRRIAHAFVDSVTVLKSSPCGNGRRIPALSRFAGVAAGAYGGYVWYPREENTIGNVGERATLAFASTLLGSFYTEFSPELMTGLTKLISSRKRAPQ